MTEKWELCVLRHDWSLLEEPPHTETRVVLLFYSPTGFHRQNVGPEWQERQDAICELLKEGWEPIGSLTEIKSGKYDDLSYSASSSMRFRRPYREDAE